MLASITPLGERGRGSTWGVTVVAFALGGLSGGAGAGALAGALGALLLGVEGHGGLGLRPRLALLAGALLVAAAVDARARPVPGPRRQVNERWLDEFRGWLYGLGFGTQLGLGVTTVVTSAGTYVALLAALLSAGPLTGAFIGACFGAMRGLTPVLAAGVRSPAQLVALHGALARWRARSRWAAVVALASLGMVAAAGALL